MLAAEQLALARKVGTLATLGAALRANAAAADAAHPGGRSGRSVQSVAGESLAEAVGLLETTPARYELALALADLGAFLRRSGRRADARDPLRRALDLAQRTGAAPLAERARRELLAAGARPRRTALTGPDALTSAERRVAGLAADGLSNRQIAQHLFITQPTVETHLRHAFQKLGITSRAGLPAQLADEPPVPAGLPVLAGPTDAAPAASALGAGLPGPARYRWPMPRCSPPPANSTLAGGRRTLTAVWMTVPEP